MNIFVSKCTFKNDYNGKFYVNTFYHKKFLRAYT